MATIIEVFENIREWESVQTLEWDEQEAMLEANMLTDFIDDQIEAGRIVIQYDADVVSSNNIAQMFKYL